MAQNASNNGQGQQTQRTGNEMVKAQQVKLQTMLEGQLARVRGIAAASVDPQRLVRIFYAAATRRPDLLNCTSDSIISALMQAATMGLEPETPLAQGYLIPRRNKNNNNVQEANFEPSYRGLVLVATRSGGVASVTARVVYEGEHFAVRYGTDEAIEHTPIWNDKDRGAVVAVYAIFTLKNGVKKFEVMSLEEIEDHRNRFSQSRSNSPWESDWTEMAKKTVLKRAFKTIGVENERLARALGAKSLDFDTIDAEFSEHRDAERIPEAEPVQQQQEPRRQPQPQNVQPSRQAAPAAQTQRQAPAPAQNQRQSPQAQQPPMPPPSQDSRGELFDDRRGDREPGCEG